MLTNQNIYDAFKLYKKDISDVSTDLFVQWCNFIMAFIYLKLCSTSPDKLRKTYNFTISSGTTAYNLPADFKQMGPWENGLYTVNTDGTIGTQVAYNGYGAKSFGYYLTSTQIIINQPPNTSQAVVLRYTPDTPIFTSLADYWTTDKTIAGDPILGDDDLEYLLRAIDVQYCSWDEDLPMEGFADQRFVRILSEMLGRQRNTPNVYPLNYNLGAF